MGKTLPRALSKVKLDETGARGAVVIAACAFPVGNAARATERRRLRVIADLGRGGRAPLATDKPFLWQVGAAFDRALIRLAASLVQPDISVVIVGYIRRPKSCTVFAALANVLANEIKKTCKTALFLRS